MAFMDETRIPLLAGTEEDETSQEQLQEDVQVEYALMSPPRDSSEEHASGGTVKVKRRKHYSGSEMIVAVFVVAFDTKMVHFN